MHHDFEKVWALIVSDFVPLLGLWCYIAVPLNLTYFHSPLSLNIILSLKQGKSSEIPTSPTPPFVSQLLHNCLTFTCSRLNGLLRLALLVPCVWLWVHTKTKDMQLLGQWFALSLFDCDDQATDLCCYQNPHKVYIDKRWEKIYSWRHDSDGCHHYGSTYSAKT